MGTSTYSIVIIIFCIVFFVAGILVDTPLFTVIAWAEDVGDVLREAVEGLLESGDRGTP